MALQSFSLSIARFVSGANLADQDKFSRKCLLSVEPTLGAMVCLTPPPHDWVGNDGKGIYLRGPVVIKLSLPCWHVVSRLRFAGSSSGYATI